MTKSSKTKKPRKDGREHRPRRHKRTEGQILHQAVIEALEFNRHYIANNDPTHIVTIMAERFVGELVTLLLKRWPLSGAAKTELARIESERERVETET